MLLPYEAEAATAVQVGEKVPTARVLLVGAGSVC